MTDLDPPQFVLITRYNHDRRKKEVIHAWGPFTSQNAARAIQREFQKEHDDRYPGDQDGGDLVFHVLRVLSTVPPQPKKPEDWEKAIS